MLAVLFNTIMPIRVRILRFAAFGLKDVDKMWECHEQRAHWTQTETPFVLY